MDFFGFKSHQTATEDGGRQRRHRRILGLAAVFRSVYEHSKECAWLFERKQKFFCVLFWICLQMKEKCFLFMFYMTLNVAFSV